MHSAGFEPSSTVPSGEICILPEHLGTPVDPFCLRRHCCKKEGDFLACVVHGSESLRHLTHRDSLNRKTPWKGAFVLLQFPRSGPSGPRRLTAVYYASDRVVFRLVRIIMLRVAAAWRWYQRTEQMRSSRAKVMTQKSTESFIKDMKPERSVRKDYAQLHNGNFDNMGPSSPGVPQPPQLLCSDCCPKMFPIGRQFHFRFSGMCLDVTGNFVSLQARQSRARRQGRRGKALGLGTARLQAQVLRSPAGA